MLTTSSHATTDHHTLPDGRPSDALPAGNRPPIALVFGTGPTAPDLSELLLSRLRFAAVVFAAVYGATLALHLRYLSGRASLEAWEWLATGSLTAVFLVSVIVARVCWRPRVWKTRNLRVMEVVLFGVVLARNLHLAAVFPDWFLAWTLATTALVEGRITIAEELFIALSAEFFAPWMLLVVTYGVLIPNSGKRSAIIVGGITAVGLLSWLVIGLINVPAGLWLRVFVAGYAVLLPAVAIVAVFTSYRLDQSRREAVERRRVGQYRLRRKLGAGGMGEVYLAEHMLLRRPCAVKVIRPDRIGDAQTLVRFEREVQITATLTHPNTVQVYDYGRTGDGTFYYAMEYLPGRNLDQLVAIAGPLSAARAVHLLRQICGALAEAHTAGLIHRDLKPSNVIACERGGMFDVAKLLDFGLVRLSRTGMGKAELTTEGTIMGTPAYLSPEQAAGDARLDARSDIYSLGALAYFLLSGMPPFANRSSMQMVAAHLYEMPLPLTEKRAGIPHDLAAVVMRCLAKNPADRYPNVREVEQALAACSCAGQWTADEAVRAWIVHPLPPVSDSNDPE